MKSDNYRIKDAASIQDGRRGADTEQAGRSHTHVDKNLGGRSPRPTPGPPAQVASARKISAHTSGCKNQWGLNQEKKLLEPQAVPLKQSTH